MKKLLLPLLFITFFFAGFKASAQTPLTTGDVVITGWNNNVAASGFREIQFVLLVDIAAGTTIKFSVVGFHSSSSSSNATNNARAAGGITKWVAGSALSKGTVVTIYQGGAGGTTYSATTGTCSNLTSGCGCGASGSQLAQLTTGGRFFMYYGGTGESTSTDLSSTSLTTTFNGTPLELFYFQGTQTAGFLTSGSTGNQMTYLPSNLSGASLALDNNANGGYYNSSRSGTASTIISAVLDPGNWTTTSGTSTVSIPTSNFTMVSAPSATTNSATSVTSAGAQLNGTVNDNGATTTVTFIYGLSPTLASGNTTVNASPASVSAGAGSTGVSTNLTGLSPGTTYYFRVSGNNSAGTTNGSILNFTTPSGPTLTLTSQSNVACRGGSTGSLTVSASGGTPGYTYAWAPSGGSGVTASLLPSGIYTCTVTDAASASATVTANITQPSAVLSASTTQINVACNGGNTGSGTVIPSGGTPTYFYSWAPSGGTSATTSNRTAGTYTVTVTDANSCVVTATLNLTQPPALSASISSQTDVGCNGNSTGAATVNPSGGTSAYSYSWALSGGNAATTNGRAAGTYTVTVTDANGCTTTASVNITQPTALSSIITTQSNIACYGQSTGSATVSAGGGASAYSYLWAPSGGNAASITNRPAGTYTCTITDGNNCTKTQTVNLTQPTAALSIANSISTNVTCFGLSNGTASVTAAGGTTNYTYNWAPAGGTNSSATGLAPNNYTVTVTDAGNCTTTQTFAITQPSQALSAVSNGTVNVLCYGLSTGTATVSANGGTTPYSYNWSPAGGTNITGTGLPAGNYTVIVTDFRNCATTQTFEITQPAQPLSAVANGTLNILCNGSSTGTATVSVSGGTSAYAYSWAPAGGTNLTGTGLAAGNYTVTVTDAGNCTTNQTFVITELAAISLSSSFTNVTCFGFSNGTASVTASGGTSPYSYSWTSGGGINSSASGLTPNTYTVTVTDAHSCTKTQTFNITEPNLVGAPTGSSAQNFTPACNTIAQLAATGSNILWYGTSSGGSSLSGSTTLGNGTHYFASQTVGGCESPGRLDVTANSTTTYTYTGNSSQNWTTQANWSPCYPGTTIGSGYTVTIASGSELVIPNGTTVTINGAIGGGTNDAVNVSGPLIINNGGSVSAKYIAVYTTGTLTINSGGTLTTDGGYLFVYHGTLYNYGEISAINSAYIQSSGSSIFNNYASGIITNNNHFESDPAFVNYGTYKGSNSYTIGNAFTNAGTVAPGNSPGCQSFAGSYTNSAGGSLDIEINGTSSNCPTSTDFDKLTVSGAATLGGTLNVNVGYTPANNDAITFISAASLSGTFATLNAPSGWALSYNNPSTGKVTLTYTAGIKLKGNGTTPVTIVDNDNTPSYTDSTNYGTRVINTSLVRRYTIQNTGTTTLNITNVQSSGTNSSEFVVTNYNTSIAAGSSGTFIVTYTPTALGTRTATITINSNDATIPTYNFDIVGEALSTYTYTGTGNWSDDNWFPSNPGNTIPDGITVINNGDITIDTDVINNGTITNDGTIIVGGGTFTNEGTFGGSGEFTGATFINPPGGLVSPGD